MPKFFHIIICISVLPCYIIISREVLFVCLFLQTIGIKQLSIEISILQILPLLNVNDTVLLMLNLNKLILARVSDSSTSCPTLVFYLSFIKLNYFSIQYYSPMLFHVCIYLYMSLDGRALLN